MKSLRKLFVLAPVALFALTACEAKLDEAKAQERVKGYNAAEVAKEYKSVDVKSECKVNKATGAFGSNGLLGSLVDTLKSALNQEAKDQPIEGYIYTTGNIESLMASIGGSGATVSYYSYKNTGLKIVGEAKANESQTGMKMTGSSKAQLYILDDGRVEKGTGAIKMSVSGESAGIKVDGALDLSFTISYTWKK